VALVPSIKTASWAAEHVRRLQRAQVQGQALLVGITVLGLLAWRFLWW